MTGVHFCIVLFLELGLTAEQISEHYFGLIVDDLLSIRESPVRFYSFLARQNQGSPVRRPIHNQLASKNQ